MPEERVLHEVHSQIVQDIRMSGRKSYSEKQIGFFLIQVARLVEDPKERLDDSGVAGVRGESLECGSPHPRTLLVWPVERRVVLPLAGTRPRHERLERHRGLHSDIQILPPEVIFDDV